MRPSALPPIDAETAHDQPGLGAYQYLRYFCNSVYNELVAQPCAICQGHLPAWYRLAHSGAFILCRPGTEVLWARTGCAGLLTFRSRTSTLGKLGYCLHGTWLPHVRVAAKHERSQNVFTWRRKRADRAEQLYSRNQPFITREVQHALDRSVIFAAGVGLTSTIAALACRTGFSHFILADGDRVEESNLNRQAYHRSDLGKNKAQATAALLHKIRPDVEVEVLPRFLNEASYRQPLARADIAISSIDFENPLFFSFNHSAQLFNKPVFIPMNLGWGGAVFAFTSTSPSLEAFLGFDRNNYVPTEVVKRLITRVFEQSPHGIPAYGLEFLARFLSGNETLAYDPQLGATAHLTAALVVRAMVALVAGEPIRAVPHVIHTDLRLLVEPDVQAEPPLEVRSEARLAHHAAEPPIIASLNFASEAKLEQVG